MAEEANGRFHNHCRKLVEVLMYITLLLKDISNLRWGNQEGNLDMDRQYASISKVNPDLCTSFIICYLYS